MMELYGCKAGQSSEPCIYLPISYTMRENRIDMTKERDMADEGVL